MQSPSAKPKFIYMLQQVSSETPENKTNGHHERQVEPKETVGYSRVEALREN